jgi:hypothetical protein
MNALQKMGARPPTDPLTSLSCPCTSHGQDGCVVHRVVQNNKHHELLEGRVVMLGIIVSRCKIQQLHEERLR